jgi:hypothetical protein
VIFKNDIDTLKEIFKDGICLLVVDIMVSLIKELSHEMDLALEDMHGQF